MPKAKTLDEMIRNMWGNRSCLSYAIHEWMWSEEGLRIARDAGLDVYAALFSLMTGDTSLREPTVEALADALGYDHDEVLRALDDLIAGGHLRVVGHVDDGYGLLYQINFAELDRIPNAPRPTLSGTVAFRKRKLRH